MSVAIGHIVLFTNKAKAMVDKTALSRVELHSHLDGSVRAETIWDLSKAKGIKLPGDGSLRDLKKKLICKNPIDLAHFLSGFQYILPPIQNDMEALERVGYEYIVDKAADGVAYVEARFSPHGLLTPDNHDMPHLEAAVGAVVKGLSRGREEYGVEYNVLLCTLVGQDTAEQVLNLCNRTAGIGVVGIDMASFSDGTNNRDEVPMGGREQAVYQKAAEMGLHRTVHAGERGPSEMVRRAVELYQAERVGHGYRVLEDETVYDTVRKNGIHLECCPWSSFLTGAVPLNAPSHPIVRFAKDRISYSVNTDDPTITGHSLSEDYSLFTSWGLTEAEALRASLNAANAAFLPDDDRQKLRKRILDVAIPDEEK